MKKWRITWQQALPYIFVAGGIIGMAASFVLTYDKLHILQNPNYVPSCNLNPVISCGSVMRTEQASLLGVPSSVYGLVAFGMLGMFGLVLLAGAHVQRWLWLAAQVAATMGVVFMHYLFFQGVFRIGAICPWCFVVWMITIPIFWSLTIYNIREGHLSAGKIGAFLSRHAGDVLALWYMVILMILLTKFWYYWETLL